MLTLDFFKNEISVLGLPVPSDAELSQIIRVFSKPATVFGNDITPLDAVNQESRLPHSFIVDGSFTAYRNLYVPDNVLDYSNVLTPLAFYDTGTFIGPPATPISIDFAAGHVLIVPAFPDLYPDPGDNDQMAFRYLYTSYDSVIERIMFRSSIDDRITEEKRGNVTIKKKSLADTLIAYRKLSGIPNEGLDVGEINFTRLSHGKVYGADPETGEVLP